MKNKISIKKQNIALILLFVALIIIPLSFNRSGEYNGTDSEASALINQSTPGFEPWFKPIWSPPSPEIESFLFTLFAVIGSSTIAYYLGTLKGKNNDSN